MQGQKDSFLRWFLRVTIFLSCLYLSFSPLSKTADRLQEKNLHLSNQYFLLSFAVDYVLLFYSVAVTYLSCSSLRFKSSRKYLPTDDNWEGGEVRRDFSTSTY